MSSEVCVEGFPPTVTEQELKNLFSDCGPVLSVEVATTDDGQPLGFATVEMGQDDAAERAIRTLHHVQLGGRTLLVYRSPQISSNAWAASQSGTT